MSESKAALKKRIKELERDCAEAYQVLGAVFFNDPAGKHWKDHDEERALDNLSAAANGLKRPHDDLLPWPKP